jgi:hypothetical protein
MGECWPHAYKEQGQHSQHWSPCLCYTIPYPHPCGSNAPHSLLLLFVCSIDVLFAIDLCLNFRTAYWSNQGELVRDSKLISARYMAFWFWVDLFATIPFDALIAAAIPGNSASLTALGFLKTPRLLRLGRCVPARVCVCVCGSEGREEEGCLLMVCGSV